MQKSIIFKICLKFLLVFALQALFWAFVFIASMEIGWMEDTKEGFNLYTLMCIVGMFVSYPILATISMQGTVRAEGEPVPIEQVRAEIESINDYDVPLVVEKRNDNKYVLKWRYMDAEWRSLMYQAKLTSDYKMIIKLNERKRRATLIDVRRSLRWKNGGTEVSFGWKFFRGVSASYQYGATWGIKENFLLSKLHEYKFTSGEVRDPIINTLLRNGWDVRFAVF